MALEMIQSQRVRERVGGREWKIEGDIVRGLELVFQLPSGVVARA